jgi:hypothetical protein
MRLAGDRINLVHLSACDCACRTGRGEIPHHERYDRAFSAYFCCSQLHHLVRYGIAKRGTFMRKIILFVASAVALGPVTMTTGALGADQLGFVGRPGLNHRFAYQCPGTVPGALAYHHGHFDPCFGPVPGTYASWYAHEHRNDDCWDGRRWVLGTRLGWTWEACVRTY